MRRLFFLLVIAIAGASARAEESSSATVRSIHFSGNVAFDAQILQSVIGLQPGTTFHAGDERIAAGLAKSHYERNGYLHARATASATSSDTGWTLELAIHEGPLYRFG